MSQTQTLETTWNGRVQGWHSHVTDSPTFRRVRSRLLAIAAPEPTDRCVDLGAGTGFVTLPLARDAGDVLAVDLADRMLDQLAESAAAEGQDNVRVLASDLATLDLPAGTVDVIVSSYALHHLEHADKRALAVRMARWLRPGGRLVIADMMFGRGTTARDRAILRQKVKALAAKGPGGLWRIAKNLVRFGLSVGVERPATPEFWQRALADAGFVDIRFEAVAAEAGIISATVR